MFLSGYYTNTLYAWLVVVEKIKGMRRYRDWAVMRVFNKTDVAESLVQIAATAKNTAKLQTKTGELFKRNPRRFFYEVLINRDFLKRFEIYMYQMDKTKLTHGKRSRCARGYHICYPYGKSEYVVLSYWFFDRVFSRARMSSVSCRLTSLRYQPKRHSLESFFNRINLLGTSERVWGFFSVGESNTASFVNDTLGAFL